MGQGQSQFEENQASKHTFTPYTKQKAEDWYLDEDDDDEPQIEYHSGYAEQGGSRYYNERAGQGEKLVPNQPVHRGLNIRLTGRGRGNNPRRAVMLKLLFCLVVCIAIIIFSAVRTPSLLRLGTSSKPAPQLTSKVYTVAADPTLVIHDASSQLNIHVGDAKGSNSVIIRSINAPAMNSEMTGNTIELSDKSASGSIDITVPQKVDLQIESTNGNVQVAGINGKVNISTQAAAVYLSQSTLLSNSQVKTVLGQLTLSTRFDPQGTYDLTSLGGDISVTTPSGEAVRFVPTTLAGTINNYIKNPPNVQDQAAEVNIQTTTGTISLENG